MRVQILCDNPNSWIISFANILFEKINKLGHQTSLLHFHNEVVEGDILILLSCEKIFKKLQLNKYNLVVHESDLPKGKGWSPLTWQVLEGRNEIPVTLIKASEKVDAGDIYEQVVLKLKGTELVDELRVLQGNATIDLILSFINKYPHNIAKVQEGESTFYPRRNLDHSKLDIYKTIDEQFNLLRVCDNERYPAWFEINGEQYILKVFKK